MPGETDPPRQYTDREVQLILRSAVDLQQRAERASEPSGGMSLAELEQVAGEAGIDPKLVRRAAEQLDAVGAPSDRSAFLGGPTQLVLERVVDVAVDPTQFDQLLDVVRAVTREVGEVSTVGRQFGWKGRLDGAKTEVSVSAADRRTTLRVKIALDEVAAGHFMLKGALFGVGGAIVGAAVATTFLDPLGPVVAAGMLGSGYLWSRHGLRGATARYRARGRELIEALAARALQGASQGDPRDG